MWLDSGLTTRRCAGHSMGGALAMLLCCEYLPAQDQVTFRTRAEMFVNTAKKHNLAATCTPSRHNPLSGGIRLEASKLRIAKLNVFRARPDLT